VEAGCTLVSCEIGAQCMIGPKSVILEGAKIEDEAIVGANSVVPPGRLIPSHQLWAGNPVRYVRDLTKAEIWTIKVLAMQK
jgi:carbonic anhydrase/acetyltransferase-like protein (isoleucine patch superfamily)